MLVRTEIFYAMTTDHEKPNIGLKECPSNAVKAFVKLLYTDEIPSFEDELVFDRLIVNLSKKI